MSTSKTAGISLITGATGKTGRRVADRLRAYGFTVRTGSRSASPAFDWDNPQTWESALRGVSAAYIAYQPDLSFPGASDIVTRFVQLAVERGVKRLVLLSGRNEAGAMKAESAVLESGVDWTIVRASFFFQNFTESEAFVEPIRAGEVVFPGGSVGEPFIDADDIADVAAAAFLDPRHAGQQYDVTGPRLLTFAEAIAAIGAAAGREIRYTGVTTEAYQSMLTEWGVPPGFAVNLSNLFAAVLDGRNAFVTDGVRRALGREPRDFTAFAQSAAATGVWAAMPKPA